MASHGSARSSTPAPTVQRSVRILTIVAIVLAVVIWVYAALMQLQAYHAATARAGQATVNIALGLEQDFERTIKSYDLSLQSAQRAMHTPNLLQLAPDLRDAMMFDGAAEQDFFGGISVIDRTGQLLFRSKGGPVAPVNVADREYFIRHAKDRTIGLLIGDPIDSRVDGEPCLTFSRRLSDPDGSFAGVIVGTIRLSYFKNMFARLDLGEDGSVSLQSVEGHPIARRPESGGYHRPKASGAGIVARMGAASSITMTMRASADGIRRLYTFQRVGSFPLLLGVGIATSTVYGDWLRQTVVIALFLVALTAICAVLVLRLRRDMIDRQQSEREAHQNAARLAMLTDHASDIMLHVGWDGTRRFVTSSCERMLGYTAAELTNKMWGEIFHPDDRAKVVAAFETTKTGGDAGLLAYRVRIAGGGWCHVESNCRALPNDEGVIFVIRDVTERVTLEERLRQAQRMEAIGQLTAGVAHDFNNMLQAQLSSLEQLGDEVADREAALQLVRHAIGMAERGARMTHQLLSFSRQQILRPVALPLAAIVPRLATLFQQMLGVRFQVTGTVDPATPAVFVDAAYLEAALLNLALNARDAMPSGGMLMLQATAQEYLAGTPPADLDPQKRHVVVSVTDDGVGMDEATLRKACEPFFTTKGVNGTGLGLASVQGFARQSGGELRIHSTLGQGTRIEIWLPVAVAQASVATEPKLPRPAGEARILLVDDEPSVLEAVGCCLSYAGFDLSEASDAETALDAIASKGPFDALVTDFMLPGRDGGELVAQARLASPGIATLVITGWAGTDRLGHLPPQTEVIYKPFKRDELIGRIKRAIAASAAERKEPERPVLESQPGG
jgi:PAS domain S-box-containing protein